MHAFPIKSLDKDFFHDCAVYDMGLLHHLDSWITLRALRGRKFVGLLQWMKKSWLICIALKRWTIVNTESWGQFWVPHNRRPFRCWSDFREENGAGEGAGAQM